MPNKASYWIRSGSYAMFTRISVTFFGLMNFILLIKMISQNEFGIWTLFLSVTTIFESLRNAFISNPFIKFLNSEDEGKSKGIISAAFYLNLATAFVVMICMFIFSFSLSSLWDAPVISPMFMIYIITSFAFTWYSHFNFLMQSRLSFQGTFFSTVVQKGGLFAYIAYLFIFDIEVSLINLAWANAFSYILSALTSFYFSRHMREFSFKVKKSTLVDLAQYGKWTLGTNISGMINVGINDWLLASFYSPRAVAIYNPAVRISNLFEVPLTAVSQIFYPKMVNAVREKGLPEAKHMYEKSLGFIMLFSVVIFITLFVLAEPIIVLLSKGATESFAESIPVLRVVLLYSILIPFHRQFGVTLMAIGMANINFYFVLASAVVSITIKFFFVKYFGVMGAAWGSVLSYFIDFVAVQIILHRILGVELLNVFRYAWQILTTLNLDTRIKE